MNEKQKKVLAEVREIHQHIMKEYDSIHHADALTAAIDIYKQANPVLDNEILIGAFQQFEKFYVEADQRAKERRKKEWEAEQAEIEKEEDEFYKQNPGVERPLKRKRRFMGGPIFTLATLAMLTFSSCGTICGGHITDCQKHKPADGTKRQIRPAALVGDILIGGVIINLAVDLIDGGLYKPCQTAKK